MYSLVVSTSSWYTTLKYTQQGGSVHHPEIYTARGGQYRGQYNTRYTSRMYSLVVSTSSWYTTLKYTARGGGQYTTLKYTARGGWSVHHPETHSKGEGQYNTRVQHQLVVHHPETHSKGRVSTTLGTPP